MLNERSQSEKTIYCYDSNYMTFQKAKLWRQEKNQWVPEVVGVGGRDE